MNDFKKLKVWSHGIHLTKLIYELSEELPQLEKYGLVSQMRRAAVSIPSNISEGSSRETDKDYKRFLRIALGSTFELETQLVLVRELRLLADERLESVFQTLAEEQRMLTGFIKVLSKSVTQKSSCIKVIFLALANIIR